MNDQQLKALADLKNSLAAATACGALDHLQGFVALPDSVNDVCEAVEQATA